MKACRYNTPWGDGWIEVEKGRVTRLYLPGTCACAPGEEVCPVGDIQRIVGFLEGYFQGRREPPEGLIYHLFRETSMGDFSRQVLYRVTEIPYGETRSYGEIARSLGGLGRARAVGNVLGRNPFPILIPCHRVIRGDGKIGGFSAGAEMKERLLMLERRFAGKV